MKKNFVILLLSVFSMAVCQAEPTTASQVVQRAWGTAVSGLRLSVSLTNTVIPIGSHFSVSAEVENTSTNVVYLGESSPEQDFSVFLVGNSGRTYTLTRTPLGFRRLLRLEIQPGKKHDWTIAVSCDRYFEPPGFAPTEKDVPAGDYFLKATRKFSIGNKRQEVESNRLTVKIE